MTRSAAKLNDPRIFEEAREAILKLEILSRLLSRTELKTVALLFNTICDGHHQELSKNRNERSLR
jgi:hypothetical protein